MTKKITSLLSIVAISALTIGCGNSSTTPVKAQEKTTGTVIDDYIKGATVCVDVNNDGKRDSGDTPCTQQTNDTGQFTFTTDVSASPLVMSGGTDVGTGDPFTGTLTAPAGSTVVNPLTTILQAIVKSGKSPAEAQTIVKTSLKIPQALDLSTYDPIAALSTGTPAEIKDAKDVFAQQSSIQTILTTVATTIAASAGTNEANVTSRAAAQIAALMDVATPTPIDIADASNVTTIINETATAESTTVDETLVAALAAQVNATSDRVVSDINNTTSTIGQVREAAARVAEVTQNNAKNVATALADGTTQADIADTVKTDTQNLAAAIATATVTPATSLTTVATEDSIPIVTGAEGSN